MTYLVPELDIYSRNPGMYCTYARENRYKETCLNCDVTDCKNAGKHTIIKTEN